MAAPFHQSRVDGKAWILKRQAYCCGVSNADGGIMSGSSCDDWALHTVAAQHSVKVTSTAGGWDGIGMSPMRHSALHQG